MKNLPLFLLLFSLTFQACKNQPVENEEAIKLKKELNTLKTRTTEKDSTIKAFVSTMNAIEENLEKIKQKEGIIDLSTQPKTEISDHKREDLIEDIKTINALMAENRNKLAMLRKKLSGSQVKIAGLEKMITRLQEEIEARDQKIVSLKDQLQTANIMLGNLYQEYNERLEEMEGQKEELNTAYYAFGSFKELKEEQILTKEGGFIGIGGTETLKEGFNRDYFTKINIEETGEIEIYSKKAELITHHPQSSYELVGEKAVEKLVIKDPEAFWSVSKYLVVVVN